MTPSHTQGEIRPIDTVDANPVDPVAVDLVPPDGLPLVQLRRPRRTPIPPEQCRLGPECLVCRWRRAGLLDRPRRRGEAA